MELKIKISPVLLQKAFATLAEAAGDCGDDLMAEAADLMTESATGFLMSAYMRNNKWFQQQPIHRFHAFKLDGVIYEALIRPDGRAEFTLLDMSESASCGDDYEARRVIEEAKVEIGL